jgi:hypothetical protein
MSNLEKFETVKANFTDERQYLGDGYYRVRNIGGDTWDLEFSLSGPCGDSILHPQIRFDIVDGKLLPIQMFDTQATPVVFVRRDSEEHSQQLELALADLLDKFLAKVD